MLLQSAYLKYAQHHAGDGHKNGMRGFHLKIYPESGAPDFEVVSAEVDCLLARVALLRRNCDVFVRPGTMVWNFFAETNLRSSTRFYAQLRRGAARYLLQKLWSQALEIDKSTRNVLSSANMQQRSWRILAYN